MVDYKCNIIPFGSYLQIIRSLFSFQKGMFFAVKQFFGQRVPYKIAMLIVDRIRYCFRVLHALSKH